MSSPRPSFLPRRHASAHRCELLPARRLRLADAKFLEGFILMARGSTLRPLTGRVRAAHRFCIALSISPVRRAPGSGADPTRHSGTSEVSQRLPRTSGARPARNSRCHSAAVARCDRGKARIPLPQRRRRRLSGHGHPDTACSASSAPRASPSILPLATEPVFQTGAVASAPLLAFCTQFAVVLEKPRNEGL